MDAIKLLKQDHAAVNKLFRQFEQAGDRAHKTKGRLAERIGTELAIHAAIEEQVFYPAVRRAVEDETDLVLESLEEHHLVKVLLSEIEKLDPSDERFGAKVRVLIENVEHHIEEEEGDMFPTLRKAVKPKQLEEMGRAMEEAKKAKAGRTPPAEPSAA